MQLNRGLSVWQKPKDLLHQILSFIWKARNKRLRGQTINKAVTNQNHTKPKRTKTVIWNQALYLLSTLIKVTLFIPWHPISLYWRGQWVTRAFNFFNPVLSCEIRFARQLCWVKYALTSLPTWNRTGCKF